MNEETQNKIRGIQVYKYLYELDDPKITNIQSATMEPVGWLTNLITAKSVVTDFSDPQINIVCELNDNNYNLAVNNYIIETTTGESGRVLSYSKHTIISTKIDTKQGTISIVTEPILNELRNGYIIPFAPSHYYYPSLTSFGIRSSLEVQFVQNKRMMANPDNNPYTEYYVSYDPRPNGTNLTAKDCTPLAALGGVEGSLKDYYGGEFQKINTYVWHRKQLGDPNKAFRLDTRTTIQGLTVTTDTSQVVNGVLHYMSYQKPDFPALSYIYYGELGTIGGKNKYYVSPLGKEYRNGTVIGKDWKDSVDLLGDPNEKPIAEVKANLIKYADQWTNENKNLNVPKVQIEVDFVSLRKTTGFAKFDQMLVLKLGDGVIISHSGLGIDIESRVNGYEYNIITDTYDKLYIGNGKNTVLDRLNKIY